MSVELHQRVEVTARENLKRLPPPLGQVGGRGLLGHRPLSIQDRRFQQPSERLASLASG
jgi:hypothetical protein